MDRGNMNIYINISTKCECVYVCVYEIKPENPDFIHVCVVTQPTIETDIK